MARSGNPAYNAMSRRCCRQRNTLSGFVMTSTQFSSSAAVILR